MKKSKVLISVAAVCAIATFFVFQNCSPSKFTNDINGVSTAGSNSDGSASGTGNNDQTGNPANNTDPANNGGGGDTTAGGGNSETGAAAEAQATALLLIL